VELNSFTLVNRRLVSGLRKRGYDVTVFPLENGMGVEFPESIPDVYIFHGFGHDLTSAPGKINIFVLAYEYHTIEKKFQGLVPRLNHYFDVLLVPSLFVKAVCERSGVCIPIEVCPWGVESTEFNPLIPSKRLGTDGKFVFLNLGGANERKGTDVLLEAYTREFSSHDGVALVIKAFAYPQNKAWVDRLLQRAEGKKTAPLILFHYGEENNIAGYYTAADSGVFPHRGEGFGLPIIECIASGRPVIVTHGAGPMDFCNEMNARFIEAKMRRVQGKDQLEPDVWNLRVLMREAFEHGHPGEAEIKKVSASIERYSWKRTIDTLEAAIDCYSSPKEPVTLAPPVSEHPLRIGYAFRERGMTSWRKVCWKIDSALRRSFSSYYSIDYKAGYHGQTMDFLVGQSEFSLELLLRARQLNPNLLTLIHHEGTLLDARIKLKNRERKLCGLEPKPAPPMLLWRSRLECDLADHILVSSSVSHKHFVKSGHPPEKIRILPWGIDVREFHVRKGDKVRFLFVGTDEFRKGARILLEAWDQLKLRNAELIYLGGLEILQSKLLLKHLVRNPTIKLHKIMPARQFAKFYPHIDCQVLPSLEDSFSLVVGEGMGWGKPAIVSSETGIKDILTHRQDGYIVKTGSVNELKEAILYFYENPKRITEMGEAAYATVKRYSWERFEREFRRLILDLYQAKQSR
jgi:glycosyltransferase involved in cell wall biosynthesis